MRPSTYYMYNVYDSVTGDYKYSYFNVFYRGDLKPEYILYLDDYGCKGIVHHRLIFTGRCSEESETNMSLFAKDFMKDDYILENVYSKKREKPPNKFARWMFRLAKKLENQCICETYDKPSTPAIDRQLQRCHDMKRVACVMGYGIVDYDMEEILS